MLLLTLVSLRLLVLIVDLQPFYIPINISIYRNIRDRPLFYSHYDKHQSVRPGNGPVTF